MRIAVIADAFPPLRSSAAVQLRDLVNELDEQGHEVTVLLPDSTLASSWQLDDRGKTKILRLRAPLTKDVSYFRRAIAEYRLANVMWKNYRKTPYRVRVYDGVIWYSPTIFLGSLAAKLKQLSNCRSYLILRDIFPEWAVDMGLLRSGLIYRYFKSVEKYQYRQADVIGIQTPSNFSYFSQEHKDLSARVEVLNNWLAPIGSSTSSINISSTTLAGRKILVYTGNIGIAQGIEILISLAETYIQDKQVGFLFVGRGTAVEMLKKQVGIRQLDNVLVHDEIEPNEIPALLAQCKVGLIALDTRHRHDNIPGKFLAYMQAGLPVLATINAGNDLEVMINQNRVGRVITSNNVAELKQQADDLLASLATDDDFSGRCRQLAESRFSSRAAVQQIVAALKG